MISSNPDKYVKLNYLNKYQTGLQVLIVNIEDSSPPNQVQAAFDDVIKAYKQSILKLHTFVWVKQDKAEYETLNLLTDSKSMENKVADRTISLTPDFQIKKDLEGNILQIYVKTTPGRILLNQSFQYN